MESRVTDPASESTLWVLEDGAWKRCPLRPGLQTLGRDMSCTINLQHPRLSRRHAEIEVAANGCFIKDLGSANGTLLNGLAVNGRTPLLPGDVLHFGPVEGRFGSELEAFPPQPAAETATTTPSAPTNPASSDRIRRATRRRSPWVAPLALLLLAATGWFAFDWYSRSAARREQEELAALRPLEELLPTPASNAEQVRCRTEFLAAIEAGRFEEAESLAWGQHATAELRKLFNDALAAFADDLARDAEALGVSRGPAAAAAHLSAALERVPRTASVRSSLVELIRRHRSAADALVAAEAQRQADAARAAEAAASKPEQPNPLNPALGAVSAADLDAAKAAFETRNLAEARRLVEAMLAGRASPAIRTASERLLRQVEAHEVLADGLARTLAGLEERRWPGFAAASKLGASRAGFSAKDADGTREIPWKVVSAELLGAAVRQVALAPAELIAAAEVLCGLRANDIAEPLLAKALQQDKSLKPRVDQVLADARGLVSIPEGGFLLLENQWVAAADVARKAKREELDRDAKLLAGTKPEEREAALERLIAAGDVGKAALRRGLVGARAAVMTDLKKQSAFQQLEALHARRLELDRRRSFATELIFDTTRYPYPYRPPEADAEALRNYRESQPEVDRRVAAVRELWQDDKAVAIGAAVRKLVQRLLEIDAWALRADVHFEDELGWIQQLPDSKDVNITTFATDAKDRERIDTSAEVLKLNESKPGVASAGEREQCRITNEYRLMMGCWAVRLYDRLTRAARGHCDDMTRFSFFAHDSPVEGKHTPLDRVTLQGMQPEGLSENIAIAGGAGQAHNGWTHSPGHHRNILMPAWRILGPGNSGRHWCQNFSIRDRAAAPESER
jgi:pSer/pThr/pTyr-binding forkhead associated (FHA) protein